MQGMKVSKQAQKPPNFDVPQTLCLCYFATLECMGGLGTNPDKKFQILHKSSKVQDHRQVSYQSNILQQVRQRRKFVAKLHSTTDLDVKTVEDNEDSIAENLNARYTSSTSCQYNSFTTVYK